MAEFNSPSDPQGDWGQGSVNNGDTGFGAGAQNSPPWGFIHEHSYGHAITNLVGGEPTPPVGAIQFTTAPMQFMKTPAILPTIGFSISFKADWIAEVGQYYMGNDFSTFNNNSFVIWCQSENIIRVNIRTGSTNYIHEFTDMVYGDDIGLVYSAADTWQVLKNGALAATLTATGFSPLNKNIVFGSYQDITPPTRGLDGKIWDVTVNGETWLFDEQTGTTATGSNSTIITLEPNAANGGSVDTMWASSTKNTTTGSFLFDYRPGNFVASYLTSYVNNVSSQKTMILETYDDNLQYADIVQNDGYRLDTQKTGDFNDNYPPIYTTQNVGGIHGWKGYKYTVAGHGKTIADDIYSVWDNGGNQIILWNIDGDDLYFSNRNVDTGAPATGVYTHVSGATNTGSFTLGSRSDVNMRPSTNNLTRLMFVDGSSKNKTVQQIYTVTDNVKIREIYDIVDEQDAKDWLVTQQGTGILAKNNLGGGQIKITNEYYYDESFLVTAYQTVKALVAVPVFNYTMFLQQVNLCSSGDEWYVPKTTPITTADGTFDFASKVPYQDLTQSCIFNDVVYEDPTSPPDRQLALINNQNAVYVQGFTPTFNAAIGVRVNQVNSACTISNDEKLYMRGNTSDKIGTSLALNQLLRVYSYKGVIPQVAGRTSSYFLTDYQSNLGFMYADWHDLPTTDSIPVPTKYQGKAFTVVEKSSNVTMVSGTLGSSLSVPVTAGSYGFLTIQIVI